MGIDGIGKPPPGGPTGPSGSSGVGPSAPARESFQVQKTGGAERSQAADPLARLERGEITVDQYLDARVGHAVEHLQSKLSVEQLDFVKNSLREQLRTDPVLLELVRRSTGALPSEG